MIKLVKVKQSFYDLCNENNVADELLFNECGRPCVLIVKLKYKGQLRDFVVPLRSNISKSTPRSQYFSLPPNPRTMQGHKHGIHYIKLFPIARSYIDTYLVDENPYYNTILNIIKKREQLIVSACQKYFDQCAQGNKHFMTPNIDGIIALLDSLQ